MEMLCLLFMGAFGGRTNEGLMTGIGKRGQESAGERQWHGFLPAADGGSAWSHRDRRFAHRGCDV
jgi:hypothetical protein